MTPRWLRCPLWSVFLTACCVEAALHFDKVTFVFLVWLNEYIRSCLFTLSSLWLWLLTGCPLRVLCTTETAIAFELWVHLVTRRSSNCSHTNKACVIVHDAVLHFHDPVLCFKMLSCSSWCCNYSWAQNCLLPVNLWNIALLKPFVFLSPLVCVCVFIFTFVGRRLRSRVAFEFSV